MKMEKLVQAAVHDLNTKFEEEIIEGLKRKGFEFSSKAELHEFIKTRCACKSTPIANFYTVDGEEFLARHNDPYPKINPIPEGITFTVHINYKYPTK